MDNLFTPSAKNVLLLAQNSEYSIIMLLGQNICSWHWSWKKMVSLVRRCVGLRVTENDVHDEIEDASQGMGLLMPLVKLVIVICLTHQKVKRFWRLQVTKQNG